MKYTLIALCALLSFSVPSSFAAPKKNAEVQTQELSHASNDSKSMNITVNPLGFFFGLANVGAQFKASDKFSIGPSVSFGQYKSGDDKATSFGVGADAVLYLSGTTFEDSWYLGPFFSYASASNNGTTVSGIGVGATIGYWWFWENGFNLSLGVGVQYVSLDFTKLGLSSISGTLPSMQFSIGYSF